MGSKGFKISKTFKRVATAVATGGLSEAYNAVDDEVEGVVKGVTGIAAAEAAADQAKLAKQQADAQQKDIAKQEALIEEERKKQLKVSEERKARMSQNLLLSGSEKGVQKNTLLGA